MRDKKHLSKTVEKQNKYQNVNKGKTSGVG